MTRADIPGLIIAAPILATELWNWRVPFEKRHPISKRVEAWLFLALVFFVVIRLFTSWGIVSS
jgi:predicted CDP-diglyceride synthetase/phosphatidate cytidylyltransferase